MLIKSTNVTIALRFEKRGEKNTSWKKNIKEKMSWGQWKSIARVRKTKIQRIRENKTQNSLERTKTRQWSLSSGGVWWKKIAEKRKERCKLHSMARARNMKKQSLSCIYLWTGFKHIFINVTPSAKTEKHTQIKAHIRDTKTQQV